MSELLDLFGRRASYEQIRNWRRGLCAAPQWAVDILAAELVRQGERAIQCAAERQHGPGKGGEAGTIALHNYRRQRALEKERAGS